MMSRVFRHATKAAEWLRNADKLEVICISGGSRRFFQTSSCQQQHTPLPTHMNAWQINGYGGNEVFELNKTRVPVMTQADQVLVKVHAASINPVDVAMRGGYGKTILPKLKQISGQSVFPATLGRDFSGVVVKTGKGVRNFKVGDEVWGITSFQHQGSHAEYTLVSTKEITNKPTTVNHTHAAAVPFVALTTWAAIVTFGGLTEKNALGKRVLVHAGSGGIGSFAIQLLRVWGAEIVTTCSTDAVGLVKSLGADYIVDYKTQDVRQELKNIGEFDMVLDTLGGAAQDYSMQLLKKWKNASYVTVVSPLLKDTDQYGLLPGLASAAVSMTTNTFKGLASGQLYHWAFCIPNSNALRKIGSLIDQQHIRPVIDQVFPFHEVPQAFEKMEGGGARGKTVIEVILCETDRQDENDDTSLDN
ncbi:reticulon-4-interacting protein 1 homolog, mitochondrial-like [Ptychodera flava]|uniref:reticulon-4-interacting protein 1 homolog, mitochondrial-like n=1 Tax=Ptychodera flava TaxID=63121 RepID=UPI00396A7858